jgi:hypothetical protein
MFISQRAVPEAGAPFAVGVLKFKSSLRLCILASLR